MAPVQGFPGFFKEINPEAARLVQLVKKPGRRAPEDLCATTSPASFRGTKVPSARLWWPGLAQALDGGHLSWRPEAAAPTAVAPPREATSSDDESSEGDLLLRRPAFAATLPRRTPRTQGSRPNAHARRISSVPALPKWLQRQIRRTEAPQALARQRGTQSTTSLASATSDAASKAPSETLPKVKVRASLSPVSPSGVRGRRRRSSRGQQAAPPKVDEPPPRHEKRLSAAQAAPDLDHVQVVRRHSWDQGSVSSPSARKERRATEADVRKLKDLPRHLGHSHSGSYFRGGRLVNADKKRNVAFKEIVLKSNRRLRVKRINYLRKIRYKGHDDDDEASSEASQEDRRVRPPPTEADTPEGASLLEAFRRYDVEETGELCIRDAKACMADLGIQPTLPQDKQAAFTVLQHSMRRSEGGLDYYDIEKLMPKMWEAIAHAKRKDLEYWHTRALDEHGEYDMQQLKSCLEALGIWIYSAEEWSEVEKLFASHKGEPRPTRSKKPTAAKVLSRLWSTSDKDLAPPRPRESVSVPLPPSNAADYEKFEASFFEAQKLLTLRRRRLVRALCEEHRLTQEQVEEFRADLVGLDFLFRKYNRRDQKLLMEKEVLELLVACGADARLLCTELVPHLIREGRHLANLARRAQLAPETTTVQFAKQENLNLGAGWRKVQKRARPRIRRSFRQYEIISLSEEEVDFFDFLYLMKFVRQKSREIQAEHLRSLFLKLDRDELGNVAIKDVMRLFRDLNLSPRSRQEQLEIKQVLNEVDEDGTGTLSWSKFTYVVQLCQERLERLVRIDEERYALALGFSEERFRELRKVFLDHKNEACVLHIKELRSIMNALQRPYPSEELLRLFQSYASSEGHLDLRGLIRLLCAIEIQRTEGQLPQDRLKNSPRRSEPERQPTELMMTSTNSSPRMNA